MEQRIQDFCLKRAALLIRALKIYYISSMQILKLSPIYSPILSLYALIAFDYLTVTIRLL